MRDGEVGALSKASATPAATPFSFDDTFISTSAVHMKYQIRKTPDEVKADTRAMVGLAVKLAGQHPAADVEFSAMDATRSDPKFLYEVYAAAIKAGATTINIPDTVGYAVPVEFGDLIGESTACPGRRTSSSACTATTTWGWRWPIRWPACRTAARQIECTDQRPRRARRQLLPGGDRDDSSRPARTLRA